MWEQTTDTYTRTVQDPETKDVADVTLRPVDYGTVLKTNEVKLEGEVRISSGDNKLVMLERAIVSWTIPLPATRDGIQRLNPLVGEQIWYYVDAGEGKPPQLELRDADGHTIVDGEPNALYDDEPAEQRGNGSAPLSVTAGATETP